MRGDVGRQRARCERGHDAERPQTTNQQNPLIPQALHLTCSPVPTAYQRSPVNTDHVEATRAEAWACCLETYRTPAWQLDYPRLAYAPPGLRRDSRRMTGIDRAIIFMSLRLGIMKLRTGTLNRTLQTIT